MCSNYIIPYKPSLFHSLHKFFNGNRAISIPHLCQNKQKIASNQSDTPTAIEMNLYDNAQIMEDMPGINENTNNNKSKPIIEGNMFHFLLYTIIGTILHTGGGFLYYLSLSGTTVPTALTLVKLKAIFVYNLSVIFLKQILSIWNCLAILISFIGIFCYVYESSEASKSSASDAVDTWWGCIASLAAAISWSINDIFVNIMYKKFFPNSKYYGSILNEALVGFWTIFIFWFVIFVQQLYLMIMMMRINQYKLNG